MRSFLMLALFTFVLPLLGAGFAAPSVVVYPITSTGASDPTTGGNIALVIATKLTELGGILVKPPTPGTTRASYLDAALALGADYYVSGFLSPLGADNSLVTQVVSTQSGSVVYSTTTNVRTYGDAIAQADVIRTAILRHAGRGLAAFDAPPTTPAASPSALVRNGNVNLSNVLRKRSKITSSTPVPTEAPTVALSAVPREPVSAATPTATPVRAHALLFTTNGPLDERSRHRATIALARELGRLGVATTILGSANGGIVKRAHEFCLARPETTFLLGSRLEVVRVRTRSPLIELDLIAYDCASHIVGRARATEQSTLRENPAIVIDRAAAAASAIVIKGLVR